jgi:tetratricopeptide (TPR) repeat protein
VNNRYRICTLHIDPNGKWALNDKGWALNGLGNYNGVIPHFDKALAIDPAKGLALADLGNYTGAIKYYDKALDNKSTLCTCLNW